MAANKEFYRLEVEFIEKKKFCFWQYRQRECMPTAEAKSISTHISTSSHTKREIYVFSVVCHIWFRLFPKRLFELLSMKTSVYYCYMLLFPIHKGDVPNPTGGVRGVIPSKQKY